MCVCVSVCNSNDNMRVQARARRIFICNTYIYIIILYTTLQAHATVATFTYNVIYIYIGTYASQRETGPNRLRCILYRCDKFRAGFVMRKCGDNDAHEFLYAPETGKLRNNLQKLKCIWKKLYEKISLSTTPTKTVTSTYACLGHIII